MKIEVDMKKCVCAGMCISLAPSLFDLDGNSRLLVIKDECSSAGEIRQAQDAMACCPVEAIRLTDLCRTE
ncbi:ferredoxin [Paraburkholderia antibiotica]|uniref:Ferredoxin n=1 Tax=Paraburkholderia antibiotica TaxID=2728839 RepID=A0A7X9X6N0_9BURK|nr:ferredoxin [Paraburkholderia antibiotica]NML32370.1 ferredoxin [Paraburkholderia antibiotica]